MEERGLGNTTGFVTAVKKALVLGVPSGDSLRQIDGTEMQADPLAAVGVPEAPSFCTNIPQSRASFLTLVICRLHEGKQI